MNRKYSRAAFGYFVYLKTTIGEKPAYSIRRPRADRKTTVLDLVSYRLHCWLAGSSSNVVDGYRVIREADLASQKRLVIAQIEPGQCASLSKEGEALLPVIVPGSTLEKARRRLLAPPSRRVRPHHPSVRDWAKLGLGDPRRVEELGNSRTATLAQVKVW